MDKTWNEDIMGKKQEMGRLAFREEGHMWNAYYALPDTMEGAIHIGSIAMAGVQDQFNKNVFMVLMQDIVTAILKEKGVSEVNWPEPRPAPEHERSTNETKG